MQFTKQKLQLNQNINISLPNLQVMEKAKITGDEVTTEVKGVQSIHEF